MNALNRGLFALPLLAIALGTAAPSHAGTIVAGQVGQNLASTATNLYSNVQTGGAASASLNWSFSCTTCTNYGISASGAAKVVNGSLGASASVTVTGVPGGALFVTAPSDADFSDMLTITGGTTGAAGVLQLTYALDGMISSTGTGFNNGSAYIVMNGATAYQFDNQGMTSGSYVEIDGSGTYADTVTFYVPFTYGTAVSTEVDLDAGASFIPTDTTPYTSTVNYYNTAALTSALVFDATGAPNNAALIGSADGLSYGPNGIVSTVPEPGTWALLIAGFGAAGFAIRSRKRALVAA